MTNNLDKFVEQHEQDRKLEDLKKTITRLHKQLDKERDKTAILQETVTSAVKDSIADIDIPKVKPPKKDTRKKSEERKIKSEY